MKIKYTEGKWELNNKTGEIRCNGVAIATVAGATYFNHEANAEQCMGNARLIELAPVLYEMIVAGQDGIPAPKV